MSGCLSADGDAWLWGFGTNSQLGKGDDDGDELLPRRLAETKRFQARAVKQLEFGGQHALLLTVPRQAPAGAPNQAPVAAPAAAQSNGAPAAGAGASIAAAVANGGIGPKLDAPGGPSAAGGEAGPGAADAPNGAAGDGADEAAGALEGGQAAGGGAPAGNGQAA